MHRLKGFTLIELITTLAIAGVVLAIGVPSFQTYLLNNRQTSSVNDLAGALQLARNNAISRRVMVTVCKSNDGATCQTGTSSGNWSQGWMVFTNIDGDTTLDAGVDLLLRVHGALFGDATFIGNRFVAEPSTGCHSPLRDCRATTAPSSTVTRGACGTPAAWSFPLRDECAKRWMSRYHAEFPPQYHPDNPGA
ncbi:MAG: prepilin-type N-terminal cleavage/methylation domain-containing protein [Gammaproteobacteria bacterium]|nr:prepilin-type N-terminal cleavage/methylation domain-containing protein [Gammaproteobacteria bacterium]